MNLQYKMKWLIFCITLLTWNCAMWCQGFVFPSEERVNASNSNSEIQAEWMLSPFRNVTCPENMQLYIAQDNASMSICDCRPKFLYFPSNNTCHEAYKRGPCPPHYYVVLPKGQTTPKCERNPCTEDGLVPYGNTCYALKTVGAPCGGILEVNENTFEVECVKSAIETHSIFVFPKRELCCVGSRRYRLGMCKKSSNRTS